MLLKLTQRQIDEKKWERIGTDKVDGKSLVEYVQEEFMPTALAIYQNNKLKCVIANTNENREFYLKNDILFLDNSQADLLFNGKIGLKAVISVFEDTDFISIDYMEPTKE